MASRPGGGQTRPQAHQLPYAAAMPQTFTITPTTIAAQAETTDTRCPGPGPSGRTGTDRCPGDSGYPNSSPPGSACVRIGIRIRPTDAQAPIVNQSGRRARSDHSRIGEVRRTLMPPISRGFRNGKSETTAGPVRKIALSWPGMLKTLKNPSRYAGSASRPGMSEWPVSRIEPESQPVVREVGRHRKTEANGHRDGEPNESPPIECRTQRLHGGTVRSARTATRRRIASALPGSQGTARKNGAAPRTGSRTEHRRGEQEADQPRLGVSHARQDREEREGDRRHVGEMPWVFRPRLNTRRSFRTRRRARG